MYKATEIVTKMQELVASSVEPPPPTERDPAEVVKVKGVLPYVFICKWWIDFKCITEQC